MGNPETAFGELRRLICGGRDTLMIGPTMSEILSKIVDQLDRTDDAANAARTAIENHEAEATT